MISGLSGKQMSIRVKTFLELVQPLPVKYGYPRGVKKGESFVTYRETTSSYRRGVGNQLISETRTYLITVQTKTAEQNLLFSDFIKHGTEKSNVVFMSDDLRKDTMVEDGWINSIIVRVHNGMSLEQQVFDANQVKNILQEIADRYIFVTSIYSSDLSTSFIDHMVVPDLEDRNYSLAEVLALKRQYLDKLLLTTTRF